MHVSHNHDFSKAKARQRLAKLTDYWRNNYDIQARWAGDHVQVQGNVMGISFRATLLVTDHTIEVRGPDPGWLLRGRVEKYVIEKLDEYLDS
ncbi:MAG: polyhydroxyalkanoic acid system family protein [Polyangia bacterium]